MEPQTQEPTPGLQRRGLWITNLWLALIVSGAVLFPMLASKCTDAGMAMAFWLSSPVLVTLGVWGYANHYLKAAEAGALRLAWLAAEQDLFHSIRYITVLIAVAYLTGFFFDPNGG